MQNIEIICQIIGIDRKANICRRLKLFVKSFDIDICRHTYWAAPQMVPTIIIIDNISFHHLLAHHDQN